MTAYEFSAPLWLWGARQDSEPGSWHFLSLPYDVSDDIDATAVPRGFGSVRVEATIGGTTWRTSVFPSSEEKAYVLPVKKPVRVAEDLDAGSIAHVTLRVL